MYLHTGLSDEFYFPQLVHTGDTGGEVKCEKGLLVICICMFRWFVADEPTLPPVSTSEELMLPRIPVPIWPIWPALAKRPIRPMCRDAGMEAEDEEEEEEEEEGR